MPILASAAAFPDSVEPELRSRRRSCCDSQTQLRLDLIILTFTFILNMLRKTPR